MLNRKSILLCAALFVGSTLSLTAQETKATKVRPEDLPTSNLISTSGPSFRVSKVSKTTTVIVYGDQRFTDPENTKVTSPKARRWLVQKIAEEKPDAVLLNGDVPYSGDHVNDYEVYKTESKPWRDAHIHVYPALGNHEFHGDPQQALDHWWAAFPELKDRRWYSVELSKAIYTIALDSNTSLLPESDQRKWLDAQLKGLSKSTKFVFISLHHPPVADFQTRYNVSHNPRPNEIALRDYLESVAPQLSAKIIVSAGHIHNYERFLRGDVTYLVSGGGGASPVRVDRAPDDLYQSNDFPNYHYVKFVLDGDTLHATMYRLADVNADTPTWQDRDEFTIHAK
ncbi:metallophosphoesterase family protein [Paracidobacterium acidisoli]|uniref:Calcineurin-like phosphoesterase domain-containing protein n=1 Tax=Paracidobacterium acidisoli TaxID=2303751 RepID=A0A372ISF8_9BACT|nr:metallophosphoesterase [Paracidobacterium acidisoli]MBT9330611.1 metallophosphoesterase [Paracidobacterium acidisoli]